jgi:hypothetical protein
MAAENIWVSKLRGEIIMTQSWYRGGRCGQEIPAAIEVALYHARALYLPEFLHDERCSRKRVDRQR